MVIAGVTIENYVRGEKERREGMGHPRVSKTYEPETCKKARNAVSLFGYEIEEDCGLD